MYRIDGKRISQLILEKNLEDFKKYKPNLGVVYIGNSPSTISYIKSKIKIAKDYFINIKLFNYDENISNEDFLNEIENISNSKELDGIIIEKPLPERIDLKKISQILDYKKDVDCITLKNYGKLITDNFIIAPSTASAVIQTLKYENLDFTGKNVVILGRSEIVGKPLALLFLSKRDGGASVTVLHSKSKEIKSFTKNADIIVSAIGKPFFLTGDFIGTNKPILLDVGINYYDGKIVGDIFSDTYPLSSAYTPVPGGIGPVTVATLFQNLLILKKEYGR